MFWIVLVLLIGQSGPSAPELLGRFDASAIPEASGIVQSRRHPGIFWVHNDSGNPPLLFAVRDDGRIVRRYRVAIANLDWEDIAIDDDGHLYLGDIGNNAGFLRVRTINRLDEPDPTKPDAKDRESLPVTRIITYRLPDANRFDAESLFLDRGVPVVIAKYLDGREAELFGLADDPDASKKPSKLRPFGRLSGFREPATGADLSDDGTLLAVCSYAVTRVYRRGQRNDWECIAEVRYAQAPIEGIAWDGRALILAAEEGRGLFRIRANAWRDARPVLSPKRSKAKP